MEQSAAISPLASLNIFTTNVQLGSATYQNSSLNNLSNLQQWMSAADILLGSGGGGSGCDCNTSNIFYSGSQTFTNYTNSTSNSINYYLGTIDSLFTTLFGDVTTINSQLGKANTNNVTYNGTLSFPGLNATGVFSGNFPASQSLNVLLPDFDSGILSLYNNIKNQTPLHEIDSTLPNSFSNEKCSNYYRR